jgi:hypothetical protein
MTPGAYCLAARATVHQRCITEPVSNGLTLALLTRPPTADGVHAEELGAPGYERQPLSFLPPASGLVGHRQLSAHRVSFGPIGFDAGQVNHAAVMDPSGAVLAYGIVERRGGCFELGEVAFDAGEIQIRF